LLQEVEAAQEIMNFTFFSPFDCPWFILSGKSRYINVAPKLEKAKSHGAGRHHLICAKILLLPKKSVFDFLSVKL
jgi:hypothetical protein